MKWTEALVVAAIREAYLPHPGAEGMPGMDEWAMLTQVPLRCPTEAGAVEIAAGRTLKDRHVNERTIDVFLARNWASGAKGHERIALEVKVSRPDYRNETPEKRAPAEASAHRCAYVTPAGLIDPAALPAGWGLIEVYETARDVPLTGAGHRLGDRAAWRIPAKRREPTCDLDYLVTAGFRRASRAEERIRLGDSPAAEVARLRYEVDSLHGIIQRARDAARREERRAKKAREELLKLEGGQECADCEQALTWKRGGPGDSTWTHVNKAHDKGCEETRREADKRRREAATGAKYGWGFAAPIEPKVIRAERLANERMETAS